MSQFTRIIRLEDILHHKADLGESIIFTAKGKVTGLTDDKQIAPDEQKAIIMFESFPEATEQGTLGTSVWEIDLCGILRKTTQAE